MVKFVKFEVFEGIGPSNRTILGKRQPVFFTPREKLTQIRPYLGSRSARNTIRTLGWGKKAGAIFWLVFYCFLRIFMPSGHKGTGRLKEGVGGGLIDLKFETLEGVSNLCSQNTGQFYSF